MATFDQPTMLPLWCRDDQSNVAQPPDSLRATGFVANEPLPAEIFNWQLWMTGNWLGYLQQSSAAQVMSTSLDLSLRLVGGGDWTYNAATKTLAWSETAYLAIPSIPNSDNALAAGSAVMGPDQMAYVQANVPATISGAITSGDTHVNQVQQPKALSVGQSVSGSGIPIGTTLTAINGSTLTLSAAATVTNNAAALTFASTGALTMQVAAVASLVPNPNTVVLAVGRETTVIVGANSGQMVVRDGESRRLLGTGFVSVLRGPAGVALTQNQACYLSSGSSDSRTAGSLYPADASAANGAKRAQFLGFTPSAAAASAYAMLVTSGVLNGFSGLATGSVYYLDPTSIGGITATRPTSAGQYAVPVGFAISASALRINPAATSSLTANSNDLEVVGNLQVDGTTKLTGALTGAGGTFSGGLSSAFLIASGALYGSSISVTGNAAINGNAYANSVASASGFKSKINFGYIPPFSANGTNGAIKQSVSLSFNTAGSAQQDPITRTMSHAGSVVGLTLDAAAVGTYSNNDVSAGNNVVTYYVFTQTGTGPVYNFVSVTYADGTGNSTGNRYFTFPKGQYRFAAGTSLLVGFKSATGSQPVQYVGVTVELDA